MRVFNLCNGRGIFLGGLYLLLLWGSLTKGVQAQSLPESAQLEAEKSQTQQYFQEKQRLDYQKQQRDQSLEKEILIEAKEIGTEDVTSPELAPSFNIHLIDLEGANQMDRFSRYWLTQPYVNRTLRMRDIQELLRDITNWYIRHGYVTTRAYLPPQNLRSRVLAVQVVEGVISDIVFEDASLDQKLIHTAFPGLKGKILNLRSLEQGLEQINRLQSSQATMSFLPAEQLGATKVLIQYQQSRTWSGKLTYDNNMVHDIAFYPHSIAISKDNLWGLNDNLYMTLSQDNGLRSQFSNTGAIYFSQPYGFSTFNAYYNQFDYLSLLKSGTTYFNSSGVTRGYGAGIKTVLYRDQVAKTTLSLNLDVTDARNFTNDVQVDVNTQKLGVGSLELSQTVTSALGHFTGQIGYHQGLKGLQEWGWQRDDLTIGDYDPKAQFDKTTLAFSYHKSLQMLMFPVALSSNVAAQYSKDRLYSIHRMSIGGLYTVRGYDRTGSLQGDMGYYWRNELSTPVSALFYPWPEVKDWTQNWRFVLGYDFGWVRQKGGQAVNGDFGEGKLEGLALGLRYFGTDLNTELMWVGPLRASDYIEQSKRMLFYWSVGVNF